MYLISLHLGSGSQHDDSNYTDDYVAFYMYLEACRISHHIVNGSASLHEVSDNGKQVLLSTYIGIQ